MKPLSKSTPLIAFLPVLSTRARNCLYCLFSHGLDGMKIRDLCARSERDLLYTKGMGRKTINEIRIALAKQGLALSGELAHTPTSLKELHKATSGR